jgi:hypothetical protein
LDFRVTQYGKFRNFLALQLPPARSVAGKDWDEFVRTRSALLDQLASLRPYPAAPSEKAASGKPEPTFGKGK